MPEGIWEVSGAVEAPSGGAGVVPMQHHVVGIAGRSAVEELLDGGLRGVHQRQAAQSGPSVVAGGSAWHGVVRELEPWPELRGQGLAGPNCGELAIQIEIGAVGGGVLEGSGED